MFGDKRLATLTANDLAAYLARIEAEHDARQRRPKAQRRPIAENTLAKHARHLRAMLRAAWQVEQLPGRPPELPASQRPKVTKGAPSYFTDAELAALWPALERPELDHDDPYSHAARLSFTTGMRLGEVSALELDDVSVLDGELRLSRQWTAGAEVAALKDGEPRIVDLVPAAQQVLEKWLTIRDQEDGLLFEDERGGHLRPDEARDRLYLAMARAGIPRVGEGRRDRTWHSLRHSYARSALEHGAALDWLRDQLGHSTIQLTADLYGRWSAGRAPRAGGPARRRVHRLASGRGGVALSGVEPRAGRRAAPVPRHRPMRPVHLFVRSMFGVLGRRGSLQLPQRSIGRVRASTSRTHMRTPTCTPDDVAGPELHPLIRLTPVMRWARFEAQLWRFERERKARLEATAGSVTADGSQTGGAVRAPARPLVVACRPQPRGRAPRPTRRVVRCRSSSRAGPPRELDPPLAGRPA